MNSINLILCKLARKFFHDHSQIIKDTAQIKREFVNLEVRSKYIEPKNLDLAFVMQLLGKKTNENSFSEVFNKRDDNPKSSKEFREEKENNEESYLFSEVLLSPVPKTDFSMVGGLLEQAILSSRGGGIGIFKRIDQQSRLEEEQAKRQQHLEEFKPTKSDMNSVIRTFLSPNLPKGPLEEAQEPENLPLGLRVREKEVSSIESDNLILDFEAIKEKTRGIADPHIFDYLIDPVLLALCPELKTPHGALKRLKKPFLSNQESEEEPSSGEDLFFVKADLYQDRYSSALALFGDSYVSEEKIWKKLAKEFESTAIKCKRKYSDRKNKN